MSRVRAYVEVDVEDLIEEVDTDDLVSELKSRRDFESKLAADPALQKVLGLLTSWDLERLSAAVIASDGAKTLDILRPLFCPTHHAPTREAYDALPRDIVTRRPLVL